MKIYRYRKFSPLFFICILQRDRCGVSGTKFYQYQLRYAPMYYNASINKRLGLLMPKTSWFRANYTDCVDCGNVYTHVCVCARVRSRLILRVLLWISVHPYLNKHIKYRATGFITNEPAILAICELLAFTNQIVMSCVHVLWRRHIESTVSVGYNKAISKDHLWCVDIFCIFTHSGYAC